MTINEKSKLSECWNTLDKIASSQQELDKSKTCILQIVQTCDDAINGRHNESTFFNMAHDLLNLALIASDYIEAFEIAYHALPDVMIPIAQLGGKAR